MYVGLQIVANASVVSLIGWTNRFAKSKPGANLSDPGQQLYLEVGHDGLVKGLNQEDFPLRIARFHSPSMVNDSEIGNHLPFIRSALETPGPNPPKPLVPPSPPRTGQYACNATTRRCHVVANGGRLHADCMKLPECTPPPAPPEKSWFCNTTFGQCQRRVQPNNDTTCQNTCAPVLTSTCEHAFEQACPGLRGKLKQCEACQKTTAARKVLDEACPLMQGRLLSRIFLLYCNSTAPDTPLFNS
jgi:hypothetical protein